MACMDVKLATATALGLSPPGAYQFIFASAMTGGVLALLHLIARQSLRHYRPAPSPTRSAGVMVRVVAAECRRIARHGSLPYGAAIACGGIWVLLDGPRK
jgi:prepilin peptidase CpaA